MENKELCSACGGRCCKKSGCNYTSSDFNSLGFNDLYPILMEGKISIVSAISFERLNNGKLFSNPILYLRARNINRPIVDLLSTKTPCSQLGENGCNYTYEERPSGGKNLIPMKDGNCYPKIEQIDIVKTWERYQKVLSKLVKRITGNSVDEQFKMDVYNLFLNVLNNNFDGAMQEEIDDIKNMYPLLIQAFPQEYIEAYSNKNQKIKKLNR